MSERCPIGREPKASFAADVQATESPQSSFGSSRDSSPPRRAGEVERNLGGGMLETTKLHQRAARSGAPPSREAPAARRRRAR